MELVMNSPFREFARVFERFQEQCPKHPLLEELRNRLARGRFPNEAWLKSKTAKMNLIMSPPWRNPEADNENLAS